MAAFRFARGRKEELDVARERENLRAAAAAAAAAASAASASVSSLDSQTVAFFAARSLTWERDRNSAAGGLEMPLVLFALLFTQVARVKEEQKRYYETFCVKFLATQKGTSLLLYYF